MLGISLFKNISINFLYRKNSYFPYDSYKNPEVDWISVGIHGLTFSLSMWITIADINRVCYFGITFEL